MDYQTAVLEGCKIFPTQAHRLWFASSGMACVNGAALAGFLNDAELAWADESPSATLGQMFPILRTTASCPECPRKATLLNLTIHLNDYHLWTRERIAQFVADL